VEINISLLSRKNKKFKRRKGIFIRQKKGVPTKKKGKKKSPNVD